MLTQHSHQDTSSQWVAGNDLAVSRESARIVTKTSADLRLKMNQKIDEYIHDICVRFFPDDEEKREELENVLDELVVRVLVEFRKETEAVQYVPDEVKHG